jgi:hypothetical protein
LEDVEKELLEMGMKIWWQKAANREEWEFVIKEDKALRGP